MLQSCGFTITQAVGGEGGNCYSHVTSSLKLGRLLESCDRTVVQASSWAGCYSHVTSQLIKLGEDATVTIHYYSSRGCCYSHVTSLLFKLGRLLQSCDLTADQARGRCYCHVTSLLLKLGEVVTVM